MLSAQGIEPWRAFYTAAYRKAREFNWLVVLAAQGKSVLWPL